MNRIIKSTLLAGLTALLLAGTSNVMAQQNPSNRRNVDPAQMRQQMMDRMKETLKVTDDGEWKVIQERIEKVMEAQREARSGMGMGMMGRQGRPGGGGQGGAAQAAGQDANAPRPGGMFGGTPNPDVEALQKALEDNASSEVIKAKLASVRESRKAAEAKLEKAQAELQKVVTPNQEATLVLRGMLK